jgi:hypothetical protein
MKKLNGLEAWLPPEGAPHIYEYSHLLRCGVPENKARKIVMDKLKKCGLIK